MKPNGARFAMHAEAYAGLTPEERWSRIATDPHRGDLRLGTALLVYGRRRLADSTSDAKDMADLVLEVVAGVRARPEFKNDFRLADATFDLAAGAWALAAEAMALDRSLRPARQALLAAKLLAGAPFSDLDLDAAIATAEAVIAWANDQDGDAHWHLRRAAAAYAELKDPFGQALVAVRQAFVFSGAGRVPEAWAALARAQTFAQEKGAADARFLVETVRAELLHTSGEPREPS